MAKQKNKDVRQCLYCGAAYCFCCETTASPTDRVNFCSAKCEREFAKEQESVKVEPEIQDEDDYLPF